ncbi:MAG: alkene reductase [Gammaproteobacteria bacterium]|nr:alkene reductase [Gammaproteobacteria bacterium]
MTTNTDALFDSVQIGDLALPNRLIMAPLTRCRAIDHLPNDLMAEYYQQRATAGLIITECTMVTAGTSSFGNEPGIYSPEQIEGWKKITAAIHQAGGRVFMQIWHGGRACHPLLNGGKDCVAPSAVAIEDETYTPEGKKPYTVPLALAKAEITSIVDDFRKAAANAIAANFDGVEVHAANGYLIDQFLRSSSNHRNDEYGGTLENRSRFLHEVLAAVTAEVGSHRVGVRLSPLNSFNGMQDSDPEALIRYLSEDLNRYDLAYLHLMRADFFGLQKGDVVSIARQLYHGHLMLNMGYSATEAAVAVRSKQADSVAFGTAFLANPDLPARIKSGAALNSPDPDTFYTNDAKGYTDYPLMGEPH